MVKSEGGMRSKTVICDIDGVLMRHHNKGLSAQLKSETIGGVTEKINEWDTKGYNIILITGRRESMRSETVQQLATFKIFYDSLIMGVGGGDRILINDRKPHNDRDTAYAINLTRNDGIQNVDI